MVAEKATFPDNRLEEVRNSDFGYKKIIRNLNKYRNKSKMKKKYLFYQQIVRLFARFRRYHNVHYHCRLKLVYYFLRKGKPEIRINQLLESFLSPFAKLQFSGWYIHKSIESNWMTDFCVADTWSSQSRTTRIVFNSSCFTVLGTWE